VQKKAKKYVKERELPFYARRRWEIGRISYCCMSRRPSGHDIFMHMMSDHFMP